MSLLRRRPAPTGRRVLVVVQNLPVLVDRRVWLECQALRDAGFTVTVICPKKEADEPRRRVVDGISIYAYAPPPATSGVRSYLVEFALCWLQTARLSVAVARREGFDVIQACNPPDTYWLLARLWRLVAGTKFVFDQHDLCPEVFAARFGRTGRLHSALLWLERQTYRAADHVISTNGSYRDVALERGGKHPDAVSVVQSCPDPEVMRRGPATADLRNGRAHLVCYVGVMGPQDGVDRLVRAAEHVVRTQGRDDVQFGLMGFGDSLVELQELTSRLGLDDHVTFTGRVGPDLLSEWLSTASVGVTPDPQSRFNDLSTMNKTFEYMAHELPVVATDLKETRRSAADAALYCTTVEDLATGITTLLDDPDRSAEMGAWGRKRIENELNWSSQALVYVSVFERLLGPAATGNSAAATAVEENTSRSGTLRSSGTLSG